jgi:hypothetical protein
MVCAVELPAYLNILAPYRTTLERVGVPRDGGYAANPRALQEAKSCVTIGLGMDWSFERDLHSRYGISEIVVFDGTVSLSTYLKRAVGVFWQMVIFKEKPRAFAYAIVRQVFGYFFFFHGAAKHQKKMVVSKPIKKNEVDVAEIFKNVSDSNFMITKIDIEGGEYQLIEKLLLSSAFRNSITVVMEWHDTQVKREDFLRFVTEMSRTHFLIHIVGNSGAGLADDGLPEVLEITWQRKDLESLSERVRQLPIKGIDFPHSERRGLYDLKFNLN